MLVAIAPNSLLLEVIGRITSQALCNQDMHLAGPFIYELVIHFRIACTINNNINESVALDPGFEAAAEQFLPVATRVASSVCSCLILRLDERFIARLSDPTKQLRLSITLLNNVLTT